VEERKRGLAARFNDGAVLFNSGEYFACHEAWEDVWRELQGEPRLFVQGLIQIAVGCYHATQWNVAGARGLFSRAFARLERFKPEYAGVDVNTLLAGAAHWRLAIELREVLPPGPPLHYDSEQLTQCLFIG
jgi:predicted metal-dependent hydrolase